MDLTSIQLLQGAAGATGSKTYVDEVFRTYLYDGTTAAQTIGNGINLADKGGFVWIKSRNNTNSHALIDTARGAGKMLSSNNSSASTAQDLSSLSSFNANGFSLGNESGGYQRVNMNGQEYASWTWRKEPGFFDVVSYTGDGQQPRTIAHSLGSVPAMIIVKKTNATDPWSVYHKDLDKIAPENYRILLDEPDPRLGANIHIWNETKPTSTHFSIGSNDHVNGSGNSYVAYVFAGGESPADKARSVDFAGGSDSDYLSAPQALIPSGTDSNQFCLETWFNLDAGGNNVIYGQYTAGNPGRMFLWLDNTTVKLFVGGTDHISVNKRFAFGQWQHLAWTYDGTNHRLFLNGTFVGKVAGSSINSIDSGNPRFGGLNVGGYNLNGQLSNFRLVRGQAVYTSSFTPSKEPLTTTSQGVTGTNCKVLCFNNSSVLNNEGAFGNLTNPSSGAVTAQTYSPFDDPEGFKFGDGEDQNIIKCGSYLGNGDASNGARVYLGFEPQWLMIKSAGFSEHWHMFDVMRGVQNIGNASNGNGSDSRLEANQTGGETNTVDFIESHSDGFTALFNTNVNANNQNFIYIAMRRPDGLVAKPPEAGTEAFAMDIGNGSSSIPCFDSGFPVDFQFMRTPASTENWYTGSRLTGKRLMETNSGNSENNSDTSSWVFDSNTGCLTGYGATWQSWMWKRGAGFDVVTWKGDNVDQRELKHNLGQTPEMLWVKSRSNSYDWFVWHKDLTSGYHMKLNSTAVENTSNTPGLGTVSTTHFNVGSYVGVNQNNAYYLATLFASVAGISKVGSYTGTGSSGLSITVGFQPRFILFRGRNAGGPWRVLDSVRGLGTGDDKDLGLNNTAAQITNFDWLDVTSTGWTITTTDGEANASGQTYIYYAHA